MLAIGLLTAAISLGGPIAHPAAVCADFANQAAAQRAHNTRDADGDGIFCETLPCPCLKPGAAPDSSPAPARAVRVGRSIALHPVTKHENCRVRGKLPDRGCTPGTRFRRATRVKVCTPGYSSAVRNVSASTKDAVYAAYGMSTHFDGSNARANLFPEAAPGSHEKDRLENALHAEVCAGALSLRRAQRLIAGNWVSAYRARF